MLCKLGSTLLIQNRIYRQHFCDHWWTYLKENEEFLLISKIKRDLTFSKASLVAQMVKHLPARQEIWLRSLCREDPLKKEMATHSSTLAWKIPWTEEPGRLQSMGLQKSWTWLNDFPTFSNGPYFLSSRASLWLSHLIRWLCLSHTFWSRTPASSFK